MRYFTIEGNFGVRSQDALDSANITIVDVLIAGDSVLYVIDTVLTPANPFPTLYDILEELPTHLTLANLTDQSATARGILSNPDKTLTFYAPADTAYAALPSSVREADLVSDLTYNLVGSEVFVPTVNSRPRRFVNTLFDRELLRIDVATPSLAVTLGFGLGTSLGTGTPLFGINGVLHAVDQVLFPPLSVEATANAVVPPLTSFLTALQQTGLLSRVEALEGVTIFAPSTAAFTALNACHCCRGYNHQRYAC